MRLDWVHHLVQLSARDMRVAGGVGGGITGFGALGQGVGMIAGLFIGGIGFGVAAGIAGWDKTYELAQKAINSILDGTFNLWSDN